MDDEARIHVINSFKNDITWIDAIFTNDMAEAIRQLSCDIDPISCMAPPSLVFPPVAALKREQIANLNDGIKLLEDYPKSIPECLNKAFKDYIANVIKTDQEWFISTMVNTNYSRFKYPPEEIVEKINSVIEDISAIPNC